MTLRIQSSQDKKSSKGDMGFKSWAMSAAAKSSKKWIQNSVILYKVPQNLYTKKNLLLRKEKRNK